MEGQEVDEEKRYFISVLPNSNHTIDGSSFKGSDATVKVYVNSNQVPTAQGNISLPKWISCSAASSNGALSSNHCPGCENDPIVNTDNTLHYSEIDPALHSTNIEINPSNGFSRARNYKAKYLLYNGKVSQDDPKPTLALNEPHRLTFLNVGPRNHIPILSQGHF